MLQDAYALWACAAVLPHWTRSTEEQGRRYRVNACQSVCLEAEQKCPWLLPVADDANPYAGEAAFTCIGKRTTALPAIARPSFIVLVILSSFARDPGAP